MEALGGMLSRVEVYSSAVLNSPFEETWQLVREFTSSAWWSQAGHGEFDVKRLGDRAPTEIGSQRVFTIGNSRLFEELTGLDDSEHLLRWVVISHPQTVSPFGQASFLNYGASIQLRPVTVSGRTFAEIKGHFLTEPHFAEKMRATLQAWYYAGFEGLQISAQAPQPQNLPHVAKQAVSKSTVMNSDSSVPLKVPVSDQFMFKGPAVDSTSNPSRVPDSYMHPYAYDAGGLDPRMTHPSLLEETQPQMAHEPRVATQSSQAWHSARAAFGTTQPQNGRRSTLGSSNHPSNLHPKYAYQHPASPQGVFNSGSSSGGESGGLRSGGRGGMTSHAYDRSMAERQAYERSNAGPNVAMLDPINEKKQMNGQRVALTSQKKSGLHSSESKTSGSHTQVQEYGRSISMNSKSSSLASNGKSSASGSHRVSLEDTAEQQWHSGSRPQAPTKVKQAGASPSTSNPSLQRRAPAPAKDVAPAQQAPAQSSLNPAMSTAKEFAYVESEQDARLMNDVESNLFRLRREENSNSRNSLEEEVIKLQQRHMLLHRGKAVPNADKPYVSPFSATGPSEAPPPNPFGAAQVQTPFRR